MAVKLPPKKEKSAPKTFHINIKSEKFNVRMFFNRVFIEKIEKHALLHFGLVATHELLAQYSVVLERESINNARSSMLEFLGTFGAISDEEPPTWRPTRGNGLVEVSNIMTMARTGDTGEIRFGVFSEGMMFEKNVVHKEDYLIEADPLALLRCDAVLQCYILTQLFAKETS